MPRSLRRHDCGVAPQWHLSQDNGGTGGREPSVQFPSSARVDRSFRGRYCSPLPLGIVDEVRQDLSRAIVSPVGYSVAERAVFSEIWRSHCG